VPSESRLSASEVAALTTSLAERGHEMRGLEPLPGDLSQRHYFRGELVSGGFAIVAVYPEELRADCRRFLTSGELLAGVGVRVPRVLASDCAAGWMLLEDLGERTLGDTPGLSDAGLARYFQRALEMIALLQHLPLDAVSTLNAPLDGALLRRELEQTTREFVEPLDLVERSSRASWEFELDELCRSIAQCTPVPCHRDFMVRNLMPIGEAPQLALLDHQGLRLGPGLYDIASLLNDTRFLAEEQEAALLEDLLGEEQERLAYHRIAAQRTLKAVGTYARFVRRNEPRRDKRRHAQLIAPTFDRAIAHLAKVPETAAAVRAIAPRWNPQRGQVDLLC
jgi:aminoglycoside/choline kinase family phosphotransferase